MTPNDTRDLYRAEDDWTALLNCADADRRAGLGYVFDRIIGTVPLFTVAFPAAGGRGQLHQDVLRLRRQDEGARRRVAVGPGPGPCRQSRRRHAMTQPNLLTHPPRRAGCRAAGGRDMIRRALPVAPVLMLIAGLVWGVDGSLSCGYAIVIVLANFVLSAAILTAPPASRWP